MFIYAEDILRAEHKLLVDAVADEKAESCFTSGYITGIVALAAELTEPKEEAKTDGRTYSN
jgi:hypothetical protein